MFELARRTGFDIESLIFAFGIGAIGVVLYNTFTKQHRVPVSAEEKRPWSGMVAESVGWMARCWL